MAAWDLQPAMHHSRWETMSPNLHTLTEQTTGEQQALSSQQLLQQRCQRENPVRLRRVRLRRERWEWTQRHSRHPSLNLLYPHHQAPGIMIAASMGADGRAAAAVA